MSKYFNGTVNVLLCCKFQEQCLIGDTFYFFNEQIVQRNFEYVI